MAHINKLCDISEHSTKNKYNMGLLSFLLKNGPGSPGKMTKYFVNQYNQFYEQNHQDEWEGIFNIIFLDRKLAFQRLGFAGGCKYNTVNPNDVIQLSEGDFPFFIFIMLCLETSKFRDNVFNSLDEVTKIIYDGVKESKPSSIKFDLQTFRAKACEI